MLRRLVLADAFSDEGCWIYPGARTHNGYGKVKVNGETRRAHRRAFELFVGPIPKGFEVCHSCDVRPCMRPAHLYLDTHAGNMAAMALRRRSRPNGLRGSACCASKLVEGDVAAARVDYARGTAVDTLALVHGVTTSTMHKAIAGDTWAHVPGACVMRLRGRPKKSKVMS